MRNGQAKTVKLFSCVYVTAAAFPSYISNGKSISLIISFGFFGFFVVWFFFNQNQAKYFPLSFPGNSTTGLNPNIKVSAEKANIPLSYKHVKPTFRHQMMVESPI